MALFSGTEWHTNLHHKCDSAMCPSGGSGWQFKMFNPVSSGGNLTNPVSQLRNSAFHFAQQARQTCVRNTGRPANE